MTARSQEVVVVLGFPLIFHNQASNPFSLILNSTVFLDLFRPFEEISGMLLSTRRALVLLSLALGVGLFSCTDDPPPVEPVQPDVSSEPAAPPDSPAPAPAVGGEAVYFAFDDYTLSTEAQQRLQSMGDRLKASQGAVVQIEGHCDERGSIEYNLALGERRAQSVKTYLSQLGVDGSRLSTISYGEEKPAVEGHDESAWAKNRRAEFTVTGE
jgi:peptidoglycan-associated lipoprotein